MMLGIGAVLASTQTNTLNSLPKEYYPDGINPDTWEAEVVDVLKLKK